MNMALLEKAVLFSWNVDKEGGTIKREILQALHNEHHLDPCFLREPKSEKNMQLIACPTVIAQMHGKSHSMKANNRLPRLTKEELAELTSGPGHQA
ncbi:hypothetical protein [Fundidesulfovibrio soli]|uniref:hypothetical protein n=1 Tax=Fundidesulfovibrio soli TaxID=2922716 RepID=UPI001FAEE7FB|nr:hypothetical protein [Fundidesulfovibrio soli]